jgi:hypothetical protein
MSAARASRPNVGRVVRVSVAPRARRVPRCRFHNPPTGNARLRGLISAVIRASIEYACASYTLRQPPPDTAVEEQLRMLREDIAVALNDILSLTFSANCKILRGLKNYSVGRVGIS